MTGKYEPGGIESRGANKTPLPSVYSFYDLNKNIIDEFSQNVINDFKDKIISILLLPQTKESDNNETNEINKTFKASFLVIIENIIPFSIFEYTQLQQSLSSKFQSLSLSDISLEVMHWSGFWDKVYEIDRSLVRRIRSSVALFDKKGLSEGIKNSKKIPTLESPEFNYENELIYEKYQKQINASLQQILMQLPDYFESVLIKKLVPDDPMSNIVLNFTFIYREDNNNLNTVIDKPSEFISSVLKENDLLKISQGALIGSKELLNSFWNGRFSSVLDIAYSKPIMKSKLCDAIRVCARHCELILNRFESYIVSYAMAGSIVSSSIHMAKDIDVFIIVDDTDLKKMTRPELLEKLRAICVSLSSQAVHETGVDILGINVQTYLLTSFWASLRDANPVIFTLLRDSSPFYDRGLLRAWKVLLESGMVRPSQEAIDHYLFSASGLLEQSRKSMSELASEKIFYSAMTAAQSILMSQGYPPLKPQETINQIKKDFVDQGKLSVEVVAYLQEVYNIRKRFEHVSTNEVPSGVAVGDLLDRLEGILEMIKGLASDTSSNCVRQDYSILYADTLRLAKSLLKKRLAKKVENSVIKVINKLASDNIVSSDLAAYAEAGIPGEPINRLEYQDVVRGKRCLQYIYNRLSLLSCLDRDSRGKE